MGTTPLAGDETPEVDELQAREGTRPAIRVCVEDPVHVQALPARSGMARSRTVGAESVRVLGEDLTRGCATIITKDVAVYLAHTRAECDSNTGAILPINVPLKLGAVSELWAKSTAADTIVSTFAEHWTL